MQLSLLAKLLLIICWIFIVSFIYGLLSKNKTKKVPILVCFITFLPIFLLVTIDSPRFDTFAYIKIFQNSPSTFSELKSALINKDGEWGFLILNSCIKMVFGPNVTAFRVICGLIFSIPLILTLRNYSNYFFFSMFLLVAGLTVTSCMMNGMRQFIAATILFSGIGLLIKKKYVAYTLLILLAFLFHKTAIIMFPIMLIANMKPFSKQSIFVIVVVLGVTFALSFTNVFKSFVEFSGYDTDGEILVNDDGTNPLRVLVSFVPLVIAFLVRVKIKENDNKCIKVCVNMSLITAGLYFISMVTSGILLGRLPWYTSLFNLILLPYLLNNYFRKDYSLLLKITCCTFYIAFLCLQVS